jgi:hypothetical protein
MTLCLPFIMELLGPLHPKDAGGHDVSCRWGETLQLRARCEAAVLRDSAAQPRTGTAPRSAHACAHVGAQLWQHTGHLSDVMDFGVIHIHLKAKDRAG